MICTVVVIIFLASTTVAEKLTDDDDDDDIDVFDMLKFDHASVSMEKKKVKKANSIDEVHKEVEKPVKNEKKKNEVHSSEKLPKIPKVPIKIPHESLSSESPPSEEKPNFDLRKCPIKKSPASPLFRQYVNTLLHHIANKVLYSGEYDMRLTLTIEDIEILKRYGDSETEVDIYTVHTILTSMIYNFREVDIGDKSTRHLWIEEQLGFSLEKLAQIMIVVVLLAGICSLFIYLKFNLKQLLMIIFTFLFLTSWLLTWYTLCKKEIAKQHYTISKEMPEYCKIQKIQDAGYLSVAYSWLTSPFRYEKDECLEYFEHLIIDPYIKVSPIEALAVTLTRFFVAPMSHIAEELSKALRMFLKDLPVHVAPVAVIGLSLFGFLILFMGFGYSISSFFITIGPGQKKTAKQIKDLEEKLEKERAQMIKEREHIIKEREQMIKGIEQRKALLLGQQKIIQQRLEKSSTVPAIKDPPDQVLLQNNGDASSDSSNEGRSKSSKTSITSKLNSISNVSHSEMLSSSDDCSSVSVVAKDANNADSVKINEEASAVNKEVSAADMTEQPPPVQCTDNELNGGIEEIKIKSPAVIKDLNNI